MTEKESIRVWVRIVKGTTVCICKDGNKLCKGAGCEQDVVVRDRFKGWLGTMKRDKYGGG